MNRNRAQSILELAAMIMFIAATIFIGGPTIIRGVQAHFKVWDDTVQDTYSDPLVSAPPQTLPTDCICDPPIGGPGQRCGVAPCGPTQRLETVICNPAGCGLATGIPENSCVDDITCCDIYLDTALCGINTGIPPDCPIGERITQQPCGGGVTNYGCRIDNDPTSVDGNPTCIPHCLGTYHPNEAAAWSNPVLPVICPGDDTNVGADPGPFTRDATGVGVPVTLLGPSVAVCSHPPSALPDRKCESYCLPGFIRNPSGSSCIPNYCLISYNVAPIAGNATNNASFTQCQSATIATVNSTGPGCANPGVPSSPCSLELFAPAGQPGFLFCQRDFVVAPFMLNSVNNQSFIACQADTITSATTNAAPGCGNPGTPGTPCYVITQ